MSDWCVFSAAINELKRTDAKLYAANFAHFWHVLCLWVAFCERMEREGWSVNYRGLLGAHWAYTRHSEGNAPQRGLYCADGYFDMTGMAKSEQRPNWYELAVCGKTP